MSIKAMTALVHSASLPMFFSGCQSGGTDPVADPQARELLVALSVSDRDVIRAIMVSVSGFFPGWPGKRGGVTCLFPH